MLPVYLFILFGFGAVTCGPVSGLSAQKFTVDLYKNLGSSSKNAGKNIAVSAFSVETALSMAYIGASGNTKSEMATTLGISADSTPVSLGNKFKTIRSSSNGCILTTANKLFLEKTFPIVPEYKNNLVDNFQSDIDAVDFKNNADAERIKINKYLEEKTNNKIHDLLPPKSLAFDTRLVLINAVYFKANWSAPFEKAFTIDGSFNVSGGPSKIVKMMHQTGNFKYVESRELEGAQVLEMGYVGGETSMVIILPKKNASLHGLEAKLTPAALESALGKLRDRNVDVTLPKFKVETGYSLVDNLKQMGIREAFTDDANFSGISKKGCKISKVEHKVFVSVDETGTEAAAATAVEADQFMSIFIDERPMVTFNADHPFIFLIRHNQSKAVLFMGRINDPTASE